ncbi:hypothetical protein RHSIM_RhsimUnG0224500 [Rhododendron simsii]|uniref:Uncharacterized protein n=1 Tax=Rhododendron simsii TaxID=118357 RepID=A0A834L233_RHOSS|nr:hypothetical protein RHSIM_RhsimUnG0224500 [Rhododendron simsii]
MAVRFVGPLKPPDLNPIPFKLDESNVVWSSCDLSPIRAMSSPVLPYRLHLPHHSLHNHNHQFHPLKSGLSAALSNDLLPLVHSEPILNSSLAAEDGKYNSSLSGCHVAGG